MTKAMGIDLGEARIGLALSDDLGMLAHPLETIQVKATPDVLGRIAGLVDREKVEIIILGMPRNMDGSYGPAAEKVQTFVGVLKTAITVPIKLWDERLTSSQANKILIQSGVRRDKRKEKVDKMAAAILLQSYLDGM